MPLRPRGPKISFFFPFLFLFVLLMLNDSQVLCSRATPAPPSPWPPRGGPVVATTSAPRATLSWPPRHGVVPRLGLAATSPSRATPRRATNATSQVPPPDTAPLRPTSAPRPHKPHKLANAALPRKTPKTPTTSKSPRPSAALLTNQHSFHRPARPSSVRPASRPSSAHPAPRAPSPRD